MAESTANLDHCMAFLREADRDRYLACLLMPEVKRPAIAALYAFNAEIARIRDVIHDPMPGEIRIQWWRDLIAGTPHGAAAANPVASALLSAIEVHDLPRAAFERYLDARLFDLYDDPMPDRATFEGYAGETASALIQLSALVLSPDAARSAGETAGHAGVALAVAGTLLLAPIHRARGQIHVPGDILASTGLDRRSWLAGADTEGCDRAVDAFTALGREHLAAARTAMAGVSRDLFPAFLPAALAGPVLKRAEKAGSAKLFNGLHIPQWRRQWWFWRAMVRGTV